MTVETARKLLGKKYKNLTDKEVEYRVKKLRAFAKSLVDVVLERSSIINFNETSNYIG